MPRPARLSETSALFASTTRGEALARLAADFGRSGVENPRREARLTLCAACGISSVDVMVAPERQLRESAAKLVDFAARRLAGEPLSRIVGRREFWGLTLSISPRVLDPRPESESIIEAAVGIFQERRLHALRILDLGVGSGALLCALLTEFPNGLGLGIDVSAPAANVARGNMESCGVAERAEICVGDWLSDIDAEFDLVVSNPPYISSLDIARLSREVRDYDPRVALDGGPDGLQAYRAILPESATRLAAGGRLLVEIGAGQATKVLGIASQAGFPDCATFKDLGGRERVLAARAPHAV